MWRRSVYFPEMMSPAPLAGPLWGGRASELLEGKWLIFVFSLLLLLLAILQSGALREGLLGAMPPSSSQD